MDNFIKSEDFVEEILSGLPPKSLMRFKCVCKLWCNLIKSPNFVAKHLSTSTRASSLPILFKRQAPLTEKNNNAKDDDDEQKEAENDDDNVEILLSSLNICNENDDDYLLSTINVPLPTPLKLKRSSDLTIAGHCDGIICLKLFIGNAILCNPGMKDFKLLPKSFLLLPEDDYELLDLELDCYTEYLGFGYDPKGKEYKVVRFVIYQESCYWFKAEVYTANSNSWREIKAPDNSDLINYDTSIVFQCFDMPIYFKGKCYWHVFWGSYKTSCDDFILSFDMGTEQFQEISFPEMQDVRTMRTRGVWKELISIITFEENLGVPYYHMWVMIDDLSDGRISWEKRFTIEPGECAFNSMLFWKSDQLLVEINNDGGHIFLYNIDTHMLKRLPIHNKADVLCDQALVYVNSIVPIDGGNILEDIDISAFYGSGKFYSPSRGVLVDISAFYCNEKFEL